MRQDEIYMARAIALAKQGAGWTNPNPLVGAVVVKEGRIIGEGFHERFGGPHAERNALCACSEDPREAAMYVTLEPCCHEGKQPPCTDLLIKAGIRRVVFGSHDPNPIVDGKGVLQLRKAGIGVESGVLQKECDEINTVFFHFITTKRPYVILKYAMTIDGKTATWTGASRWITGKEARRRVHDDRGRYAAIMVGIGTAIADDPLLTCRAEGAHQPLRIICDSYLLLPPDSQLVKTAPEVPLVVACADADPARLHELEQRGCQVWQLANDQKHISGAFKKQTKTDTPIHCRVDLEALMNRLGASGIDSVIIEGGPTLAAEALKNRIVNRVHTYVAPKIFGGKNAPSPVGGQGVQTPDQALRLKNMKITPYGKDVLIEGDITYEKQ